MTPSPYSSVVSFQLLPYVGGASELRLSTRATPPTPYCARTMRRISRRRWLILISVVGAPEEERRRAASRASRRAEWTEIAMQKRTERITGPTVVSTG